jgi:glucosamine-6-phosphate deaminase
LGLPTGSTPLGLYQELIRLHREEGLSFAPVVTFNMDEYRGLGPDHPRSFRYFMQKHFFDHIDLRPENIHFLSGLCPDEEAECAAYEEQIRLAGGIELFLGGAGEDGHLAFNEPYSSLSSRTRLKTLTQGTRQANARFFEGDLSQVPRTALTVGIGTILDAREVLIAASGQAKAEAVRQGVEGPVSHRCPLSALQLHPRAALLCDRDAAARLAPETLDYFSQISAPCQPFSI